MTSTVTCTRCGRSDAPALTRPPLRGPLGAEILTKTCGDCWSEWQRAEVMVINELRLNFMDPGAQAVLDAHLRQFLVLDSPADAG